jgi:hypothetical protein
MSMFILSLTYLPQARDRLPGFDWCQGWVLTYELVQLIDELPPAQIIAHWAGKARMHPVCLAAISPSAGAAAGAGAARASERKESKVTAVARILA